IELVTGNPTDVTLEIISMTADSGASASDFITNDGSAGRTLSGILSRPLGQGERVLVSNGIQTLEAVVNGINWTLVDPDAHSGGWDYRAWVENAVTGGNSERAQQTVTFDNDIVRATIDSIYDSIGDRDLGTGATTTDRTPTLSGRAEADSLVTIYDGTTVLGSVHANSSGDWTWTTGATLQDKTYSFNVVAKDTAGNQSAPSSGWEVKVIASGNSTENWDDNAAFIYVTGRTYHHKNGLTSKVISTSYSNGAQIQDITNSEYYREIYGKKMMGVNPRSLIEFKFNPTDAFSLGFVANGPGTAVVRYYDTNGIHMYTDRVEVRKTEAGENNWYYSTFFSQDGRDIGEVTFYGENTVQWIDKLSWGDDVVRSGNNVTGEEENNLLNETDVNALENNKENEAAAENKGQIDLTGEENNQVTLNLNDLLTSGEKNLFIENGKTQLLITGDENDTVQLDDLLPDGTDTGDWIAQHGTVTVAGIEYQVYTHSGEEAEVLIQQGIKTELI
ncbi:Ig-like domain-containing protein, partial [Duffyella gerundensis]|uniref:Ig-like domain-containing protein n=2 Tax=Duffyella gerundensis TaxID=1619313 RepID=UPI0016549A3B